MSTSSIPYNIDAERNLLGSFLINNENFHNFEDKLSAEYFYEGLHQRLFKAISNYIHRGIAATPITLKNFIENDPGFREDPSEGVKYLNFISSVAIMLPNIEPLVTILFELYMRRQLIAISQDIHKNAYEDGLSLDAQVEFAEKQLFDLISKTGAERGFSIFRENVNDVLINIEKMYKNEIKTTGVSTGSVDLDRVLGGFQESDLIILAARPSMGKTALAVNFAINIAKSNALANNNKIVGFFSLEMSTEQIVKRTLAMEADIDSFKIRTGIVNRDEFGKLMQASDTLSNINLYIDDTPALKITGLRTRVRRLFKEGQIGAIFVDYLQLMHGNAKSSADSRVNEVSEITRGLKAIAKEFNVPVIALSQLSRAVESRENKRPQLSDLRESGSIEQDADVVMFIYREEYYEIRNKPSNTETKDIQEWQNTMEKVHGHAEVIIAKHRNGPVGSVKLYFDHNTTKFGNLEVSDYEIYSG